MTTVRTIAALVLVAPAAAVLFLVVGPLLLVAALLFPKAEK